MILEAHNMNSKLIVSTPVFGKHNENIVTNSNQYMSSVQRSSFSQDINVLKL